VIVTKTLHADFNTKLFLLTEERIKLRAYILKFGDPEWYQDIAITSQTYKNRLSDLEAAIKDTLDKLE